MPKNVTQYNVLIASPSDVMKERHIVRQVIQDWNASAGLTQGINLAPVIWETHATPEMGDRPQAIINRQLVDDCDILVGVFWTRMGSPTGAAVSGTAEEISLFVEAQKPALVYFSSMPISPSAIDVEQYQKLLEFKRLSRSKGLLGEFCTQEELRAKLHADLTRVIGELHKKTVAQVPVTNEPPRTTKPSDDKDDGDPIFTNRVPFEELTKDQRIHFQAKATRALMGQGVTSFGPNAINGMARGLYYEETKTVEDLRHEFMASQREAMRQERQTEDVRKATSRMPKNGKK